MTRFPHAFILVLFASINWKPTCANAQTTTAPREEARDTMVCSKCGQKFARNYKFCPNDGIALVSVLDSTRKSSNESREITLASVSTDFAKLRWKEFLIQYPSIKDGWYLVTGELELINLGEIKMYGVRQAGVGVIVGQDSWADHWFPALRLNVGKTVIVGSYSFGRATFMNPRMNTAVASKGYQFHGEDVLNLSKPIFYGMTPKEGLHSPSECASFTKTVDQICPPGPKASKPVDPKALPAGSLTLVVITPVTAVFSTSVRDLHITIEGPIVERQTKSNVATATPVDIRFNSIPQGKYEITATYGSRTLTRTVDVGESTQVLDLVMN